MTFKIIIMTCDKNNTEYILLKTKNKFIQTNKSWNIVNTKSNRKKGRVKYQNLWKQFEFRSKLLSQLDYKPLGEEHAHGSQRKEIGGNKDLCYIFPGITIIRFDFILYNVLFEMLVINGKYVHKWHFRISHERVYKNMKRSLKDRFETAISF